MNTFKKYTMMLLLIVGLSLIAMLLLRPRPASVEGLTVSEKMPPMPQEPVIMKKPVVLAQLDHPRQESQIGASPERLTATISPTQYGAGSKKIHALRATQAGTTQKTAPDTYTTNPANTTDIQTPSAGLPPVHSLPKNAVAGQDAGTKLPIQTQAQARSARPVQPTVTSAARTAKMASEKNVTQHLHASLPTHPLKQTQVSQAQLGAKPGQETGQQAILPAAFTADQSAPQVASSKLRHHDTQQQTPTRAHTHVKKAEKKRPERAHPRTVDAPQLGSAKSARVAETVTLAKFHAVSLPPATQAWVVQVGTFYDLSNAERIMHTLQKHGYSAYMRTISGRRGRLSQVFVGPYLDKKVARQVRAIMPKYGITDALLTLRKHT